MKKQVIVIHGGGNFDSYSAYLKTLRKRRIDFSQAKKVNWKQDLQEKLGSGYDVLSPSMPCKDNAKYPEWKIWFEKYFPILKKEIILVGHSLGGIFLAKYLSENIFPNKISSVHLVAAPFSRSGKGKDFLLPKSLKKFERQAEKIFIYHSKDDHVVPFSDFQKYEKELKKAKYLVFRKSGHFTQRNFPKLINNIINY